MQRRVDDRVVFGGVGEELGDLVGGPDHDRSGNLAGGLPPLHAFGFPHDRHRPVGGRLDQGGGVGADDEFVGQGVVDGLAEGSADVVAGGRPGRSDAGHRSADVRIRTGLQQRNLGVAAFHGREHRTKMAGPQLVQRNVAEVRNEVDPDNGFVSVDGVDVGRQGLQPPGQVLADRGHVAEWPVAPQSLPDAADIGERQAVAGGVLDDVADLDLAAAVTAGEGEQRADVIAFSDGLLAGVDAGAAQQAALAVGGGWEFELVGPESVLGVPGPVRAAQQGALGAVLLVGAGGRGSRSVWRCFLRPWPVAPIIVGNGLSWTIDDRLADRSKSPRDPAGAVAGGIAVGLFGVEVDGGEQWRGRDAVDGADA